jgi:hypothetical protein
VFWSGVAPEKGRSSLRQALWIIRKAVGDEVFSSLDPVSVAESDLSCDVNEFRAALRDGRIAEARELRRGPFLDNFAIPGAPRFKIWIEETRDELDRLYQLALQASAAELLEKGLYQEAVEVTNEGLALSPHSLELHRLHLESLLAQGDASAARRALLHAEREIGDIPRADDLLEKIRQRIQALPIAPTPDRDDGYGFHEVEFVGRTGEFSRLLTEVRRAQKGQSRIVGITGVPGIGKTRLALEALRASAGGGARTVRVKCHKAEKKLTWGVVGDLVGELVRLPGSAGVSSATDTALSTLTLAHSANGGLEEGPGRHEPTVYAEALLDLIRAAAFEGPITILVDDVQWMDQESRAVLARVIRRLDDESVLLLFTTRDPLGLGDFLEEGGELMELGPLDRQEVLELLRLAVIIRPEERVGDVGNRIVEASTGNPLFIGELLRQMADTGVLTETDDGWELDANNLPGVLSLPESVGDLIAARLAKLPRESMEVCASLATGSGGCRPDELRQRVGMSSEGFLRTVSDLVSRGVLEWVSQDRLDFAHDYLREEVRSIAPADDRGWRDGPLIRWSLPLALAALLTVFLVSRGGPKPPTLLDTFEARGTLLAFTPGMPLREVVWPQDGDSVLGLRVSDVQPPEPPAGNLRIQEIRRSENGRLEWFGSLYHQGKPDAVVADSSGWRYVLRTPGDDHILSVSPEGRFVVLIQALIGSPEYSVQTLLWDRRTGRRDTIISGHGPPPGHGDWSPDGRRYAFIVKGRPDSVLVLEPGRGIVETRSFPDVPRLNDLRWCRPERLALRGKREGVPVLAEAGLSGTDARPLALPFYPKELSDCLPGGRHLLIGGADGGGRLFGLVQLDSLRVLASGRFESHHLGLHWIPHVARVLPIDLVITGPDSIRVDWGSFTSLSARFTMSDGSTRAADPNWKALSPHVASVSEDGVVAAVRPGTARIVAERDWMADTLTVRVDSKHPANLAFHESFGPGWADRWSVLGSPPAAPIEVGGGRALSLNGDGASRDGAVTRQTFDSRRGLTLDLEFRMGPLTRRARQRISFCLGESSDLLSAQGPWFTNGVCFQYPAAELVHFDPGTALLSFYSIGVGFQFDVSSALPSQNWIPLRMEIQPDGMVRLFLGGALAAAPDLPVRPGSDDWRVVLGGASLDTEVLVRNVNMWEGLREPARQ